MKTAIFTPQTVPKDEAMVGSLEEECTSAMVLFKMVTGWFWPNIKDCQKKFSSFEMKEESCLG